MRFDDVIIGVNDRIGVIVLLSLSTQMSYYFYRPENIIKYIRDNKIQSVHINKGHRITEQLYILLNLFTGHETRVND